MDTESPDTWDRATLLRVMRRAVHDMAEPLRGIGQVLDYVRDPEMSAEERDQVLAMAATSARRAEDMLSGARKVIAALEDPLDPRAVDVAAQLDGDVAVEGQLTVRADAAALGAVLHELVGNARKFGKGPVRVALAEAAGQGVIRISSPGAQIPAEQADRIFAPFHRLHPKSDFEGAGLGLTICRAWLARMEGSLALGRAGHEPVFEVRLPCAQINSDGTRVN